MKLLAFADLHGRWWRDAARLIQDLQPDWVVLLGDMLPDFDTVPGVSHRAACQTRFVADHGAAFKAPGIPILAICGNHEAEGWTIPVEWQGVPSALVARVVCWPESTPSGKASLAPDPTAPPIVLSHWPPLGCLDGAMDGEGIGDPVLRQWLEAPACPSGGLVLCGHVHEGFGLGRCGDALVVNAAEGYALLETASTGRWQVVRMERMETVRAHRDLDETWD